MTVIIEKKQYFDPEQIQPYFQPIVCVSTSKILGYEVLGRVQTPVGMQSLGPFFHDEQISDAAKVEVDRIVRYKALERFKKAGKDCLLFINIQPRWLIPHRDYSALPTLDYLNAFGIDGERIVIEICESGFQEETQIMARLIDRYRQAGCQIALDDFGQGFTDLDRIIQIRPNYLKMRMTLPGTEENHNFSRYMLESLGVMCQKTGLNLILEEVESIKQFENGLRAGARYFQGYYFSRPVPDLVDWDRLHQLINEGLQRCRETVQNRLFRRSQTEREINRVVDLFNETLAAASESPTIIEALKPMLDAIPSGWLRVYCCQSTGYQLTPNYIRESSRVWRCQTEYAGRNWSWRPYFFPNISESRRTGKGVLSDTYLDIENGHKIWTFTCPMNSDIFLFIDNTIGLL